MNSRVTFPLVAALVLMALPLSAQPKKYDIKSGVVTYETVMSMGTFKMTQKYLVSFDDYGMKECKDLYDGAKMISSYFSDGKQLYHVDYLRKTVTKRGDAYRGTEVRFDWNEIPQKIKEQGKAKQLPHVKIAGKDCESFETIGGQGKTIYAGWGHILFYLETTGSSSHTSLKATRIEENAKVPAEKFVVPTGYTMN